MEFWKEASGRLTTERQTNSYLHALQAQRAARVPGQQVGQFSSNVRLQQRGLRHRQRRI